MKTAAPPATRWIGAGRVALRFAGCAGLAWFGFYLIAWYGTLGWGFSAASVLNDLGFALILLGPTSLIPFIGCAWRSALLGALATFVVAFVPGEVFARAQEYQAIQTYGVMPEQDITISRWAPFEYHTIAGYKGKGWSGWD